MTVVTSVPARRERKKVEVRSRLIESAITLFEERGIDAVTVDRIAERADVGKGTVYNYFRTKEDIIVAFMMDQEQRVQQALDRSLTLRGSLDAILTRFVRTQLDLKRSHHAFVRVFLGQMFSRTEAFRPYMVEIQKLIDPPIEKLFARLRHEGMLRPDVDPAALVTAFKTIQLGVTALWAVEGPPFRNTEAVLRLQMKLFANGLEKKAA